MTRSGPVAVAVTQPAGPTARATRTRPRQRVVNRLDIGFRRSPASVSASPPSRRHGGIPDNRHPFGGLIARSVAAIRARLQWIAKPAPLATRLVVLALLACVASVAVGSTSAAKEPARKAVKPRAGANDLYVSPTGSDSNSGRSPTSPLRTIQSALDRVVPGAVIHLAAGTYTEAPRTVRDGTAASPITLRGPGGSSNASARGLTVVSGTGRILNIDHSHYRLEGFTVDGEPGLTGTTFPTSLTAAR